MSVAVSNLAMFRLNLWLYQLIARQREAAPHDRVAGAWWGIVAGFTSFVAHAGGPPYQVYAMRLRQDPKLYTGTAVIFFAAVNVVKLVPYFALGLFDTANLAASAVLMPVAPIATLAGAWIVKRMKPEIFYPFMYVMIMLVGVKLVWDATIGGG